MLFMLMFMVSALLRLFMFMALPTSHLSGLKASASGP
jgi:hypothetical protein